jgi:integrase
LQGKLTKRIIDGLLPKKANFFFWDTELKGFGLKVTPSGSKVYVLQYRMGGRETTARRFTLGKHGAWTLDRARKEALKLLALVAGGTDPAEAKQANKAGLTLATFSRRYLDEYAEVYKKPRSVAEDRRNLTKLVLPVLGEKRIDKITRTHIAKLHHDLLKTPVAANRVLAVLTTLFNLAERWGHRPDGSNPCRYVQKFKERKRERFLSEAELTRLGMVLRKAEQEQSYSLSVLAGIRLLIFLGARLSEVLSLKWDYINFETQSLRLPDSKTGAKTLYLSPPALTVLDALPRIQGNPYVLPGVKEGAHLVNLQAGWAQLRQEANLKDVRLHDLRHNFASVAVGEGMSLPMIGALLGHQDISTTSRYAHLSQNPLRQANEVIGNRIHAVMSGKSKAPLLPFSDTQRKRNH